MITLLLGLRSSTAIHCGRLLAGIVAIAAAQPCTLASADSATSPPRTPAPIEPVGSAVPTPATRGVFLLPLKGTVGIGLRHQEIERIAEEADKHGPGQIIVLEIDSPGGLVVEAEKIHEVLKKWKTRHRFVAWIREAISAAAFTALHCDEIIFMRVGALGAMTMFAGERAIEGERLQAWLKKCSEVAAMGGRDPIPVRAMIHAPLLCSYDKDPATGKVTWYDTLQGRNIVSDEKDNLSFNATNGLESGFIDGVADRTDELARLLQLAEWREINDVGRRMAKSWQDTLAACMAEVPRLVAGLADGGLRDEAAIRSQLRVVRELIRWWDRCPNGMEHGLREKGMVVPDKARLERVVGALQVELTQVLTARKAAVRR